ncbi:flagellar basal body rod protein FlgC (plasmid) [Pseudomonas silesiensis]|uniref:flagellar basal body rod protein FlgC n=1 Tax=Pseudomonas silesiensis TaxID=1853130 RepID=UPI0030CF928C
MTSNVSMFTIFDTSGSALSAQSKRMNVAASNMANADSVSGPDGQPYRAKQVMFEAADQGRGIGGVRVTGIVDDPAPMKMEYKPGDPNANADGYVTMPNVNPVNEMVNMISASRSYQANVEVMNTSKELMAKTLTIAEA